MTNGQGGLQPEKIPVDNFEPEEKAEKIENF
jgi:hypothetical protein